MSEVAIFLGKRVLRDLAANGGRLRRDIDAGNVSLDFGPGADRARCRSLVSEAKDDPPIWAAILRIIASQEV